MAKYINADRLKAEIDRIEEEARKVRVSGTDKEAIGADGKIKLCLKLKSLIDSLPQEQSFLPSNLDEAAENRVTENGRFEITSFEKMRIDDIMFGAEWMARQMKQEQPEADLEKEIEWEWVHREKQEVDLIECAEMDKEEFARFARHFAEWGAEHLKK